VALTLSQDRDGPDHFCPILRNHRTPGTAVTAFDCSRLYIMAPPVRAEAAHRESMKSSGVVRLAGGAAVVVLVVALWAIWPARSGSSSSAAETGSSATVTVRRGTFLRTVRVAGITESVRAAAATAPRLAGQSSPTLVITSLIKGGTRVRTGDVLVEFDPQDQVRAAFDRRTDLQDLEQQIRRLEAEQAAAWAGDETAMLQADNDVSRARLEVRKNRVLPAVEAEKNTLSLEEAEARANEVKQARALRRQTAEADLKILHIRRERLVRALDHAEQNADYMVVRAPFDGLAVVQPVFKGSAMTEVQEGDEVRSGMPVVQVVDPASMQVRVRVSQVDRALVAVGQSARIGLDAYPGLVFDGTLKQVAPLAVTSSVTPAVRSFVALVSIVGANASLMPDLSAAVDIVVQRRENVLVLPREAVAIDADGAWVRVRRGGSFVRHPITVGDASDEQAIVVAGVPEGAVVARRATGTN
jgi:HlyD family secretion protein